MMMRKLDRGELQDRLPDYVRGELPEDERRAVEAAVASDADLKRDLDAVRMARAALSARAADVNVDRIVAALPKPMGTRKGMGVAGWRIAAAIATLAVGGASLTVARGVFRGDNNEPYTINGSAVAAAEPLAISFGYGLSDLSADEIDNVIAALEKYDGLPAAQARSRAITPQAEVSK